MDEGRSEALPGRLGLPHVAVLPRELESPGGGLVHEDGHMRVQLQGRDRPARAHGALHELPHRLGVAPGQQDQVPGVDLVLPDIRFIKAQKTGR